jgi:hypothetical protein
MNKNTAASLSITFLVALTGCGSSGGTLSRIGVNPVIAHKSECQGTRETVSGLAEQVSPRQAMTTHSGQPFYEVIYLRLRTRDMNYISVEIKDLPLKGTVYEGQSLTIQGCYRPSGVFEAYGEIYDTKTNSYFVVDKSLIN